MNTKHILLLALSSALLPFTTQAQSNDGQGGPRGERPSPEKMFQRLDQDGSGTLSASEVKGPLAENFAEIDADGNGELTKEELKAAHKERGGERGGERNQARGERAKQGMQKIKAADTDENGSISKAEAEAANLERLLENFDELDADGDGEITRDEMKAARQGKGPRGGKGGPNAEDGE